MLLHPETFAYLDPRPPWISAVRQNCSPVCIRRKCSLLRCGSNLQHGLTLAGRLGAVCITVLDDGHTEQMLHETEADQLPTFLGGTYQTAEEEESAAVAEAQLSQSIAAGELWKKGSGPM